jgi:hypothetical protein
VYVSIRYLNVVANALEAVFDLGAYLPDAVKPQYETVRNTLLSWLGAPQAAKSEADNEGSFNMLLPT